MLTQYDNLLQELQRLGRLRQRRLAIVASAALAVAAAAWLWLGTALDLGLGGSPVSIRYLFFLVLLAGAAAGTWNCVRCCRRRLTNQALAALIETAKPGMHNSLINAVQFLEGGQVGENIISAVLQEAPLDLPSVRPAELHSQRLPKMLQRSSCILLVLWLALFCYSPLAARQSLFRLLAPFSQTQPVTATRIAQVTPGHCALRRGQELALSAVLAGKIPAAVQASIVQEGQQDITLTLLPDEEDRSTFSGQSTALFAAGKYRILAGDAVSPWFKLEIVSPPALVDWEARVTPPESTGKKYYALKPGSQDLGVPADSLLVFKGSADTVLHQALLLQGNKIIQELPDLNSKNFTFHGPVAAQGNLSLRLVAGIESDITLPLLILPDRQPKVTLIETPLKITIQKGEALAVGFLAEDDYAIARAGLEQVLDNAPPEQIRTASPEQERPVRFPGRFLIDTASFKARSGESLRFRVWAEDYGREPEQRRGYSPLLQVVFADPGKDPEKQAEELQNTESILAELIQKQRRNLQATQSLADLALLQKDIPPDAVSSAENEQLLIRQQAVQILEFREILGGLADVLSGLINEEMLRVLEVFDQLHRASAKAPLLQQAVLWETRILAALTGLADGLKAEQAQQDKRDLFAFLQRLVKKQKHNLGESKKLSRNEDVSLEALVHNQDAISEDILAFADICLNQAEMRSEDDFALQARQAHKLLEEGKAYDKSLQATELLEGKKLSAGIPLQEDVLRTLLEVLNLLNQWRMNNARRVLDEAAAVLQNTADKLDDLEKQQARIAEVTRDLKKRGPLDDAAREQLAKMDQEQKDMADLLEKLANDLYQFPELPVCNELNSRMREIYESVLQALDSENMPALEIAVQKEDAILDAIRKTKERIEDVEMWLLDIPDNIVWNMESFDVDEFPEIPLVPLPDELEDLVGDLLDQASDIDAQSQDTTGNNIIADAEMGWMVADGPMPSFAAKGKSGNTRPNDNEMTGRSGAGREGQSTGELVENHVKGYEGRQTKARRTQDQFQKGMVTEDENSTLDARATGGGKLGGESETQGMFGSAPRRDLHTPAHGQTPQRLRQETEALYATARLLYLGTGSLGEAARELRGIENAPPQMQALGNLHRRVLRRLEDTQVEMKEGVVLPMTVLGRNKTGGSSIDAADVGQVAEEYRDLLNDYYRSLEQ
ncbi:MAG: hypothetical protein GX564_04270 [Oligosphaeraceae bacterium]|nr:hypothetical protein [Oligosphaeraceae bacterium]